MHGDSPDSGDADSDSGDARLGANRVIHRTLVTKLIEVTNNFSNSLVTKVRIDFVEEGKPSSLRHLDADGHRGNDSPPDHRPRAGGSPATRCRQARPAMRRDRLR